MRDRRHRHRREQDVGNRGIDGLETLGQKVTDLARRKRVCFYRGRDARAQIAEGAGMKRVEQRGGRPTSST
jgi:hypothetical protein